MTTIFDTAYRWWLESPEPCSEFVFRAVQKTSKRPDQAPLWTNSTTTNQLIQSRSHNPGNGCHHSDR